MSSYIPRLVKEGKIFPPRWLENNVMFEGITGSVAYGVSNDSSDMDIIGFCIPPKDVVFPHLRGEIPGFGTPGERFEQFQQHHIEMKAWGKTFDITIYSIVKFVQLAMENNPNMVDSLFLPRRCVLHSTQIYEHLRENRQLFLHKGSWHKFRGYAYSQLSKVKSKTNPSNEKRAASVEKYGFDVKFAYHVVRLLLEVEQIMMEGDLTLDRNAKMLKSIREGEWTLQELEDWAGAKEKQLEALYHTSSIPHSPDQDRIKAVLLECMEMHYGSLSAIVHQEVPQGALIDELEQLIRKYKR